MLIFHFQTFSDFGGDYKMVLVVRNDLKMGKGKIAAQCGETFFFHLITSQTIFIRNHSTGHAAVGAYERGLRTMPGIIRRWSNSGQTKVAVRVESEQELKQIRQQAISRNLNVCMIRDAGRTQIEPNTATVVAVGPGLVREVDQVTGHLKLL